MSLILKSMWRGILSARTLTSPAVPGLRPKTFSSGLTEAHRSKSPDAVMARIRGAPSAAGVLDAVQAHLPTLTHKHLLLALRCLFELQKNNSTSTDGLIKDPAFGVLCQNFKKHARALDVSEAIEATKVLSYLGVPVDSMIVQTMLQLIRSNINFLNIRQIMFLDFLLTRFDGKNHLVDALKLALPLAFQIHLPLELDNEDLYLLRDMLSFCCVHELPDRCINNIVTGLLLHDQAIDAQLAKSIIWSLCQINCTEVVYPTRVQLLHICYDILTQNIERLSYDEVLRTAAKIKGRVLEKHPEYYHEQLMDSVAGYVVKNEVDFEKGLLIARVLSRIAHTHLGLVEYLCRLAAEKPNTLREARTNILFGFINFLANNNYIPDNDQWEILKEDISANPILNAKNAALPWTKVCLELASLKHYDDKLLARVFSNEFLEKYLSRENNTLDYLQLLTLHEAVNCFHSEKYKLPEDVLEKAKELYPVHNLTEQLEEALARGLGGSEYVVRNVLLPNGIVADVMLCVRGGVPLPLPLPNLSSSLKIPVEHLNLPAGGIPFCIMNFNQGCFSMNSNRLRGTFRLILDVLEHQGYAALAINVNEWLNAPAHERSPYLIREVGYKCAEFGMRLHSNSMTT